MTSPADDLVAACTLAAHLAIYRQRDTADYTNRDDVANHVYVTASEDGLTSTDTGRLSRIARDYVTRARADHYGYDVTDQAWYSPQKVSDLLPAVLDGCWDGLDGESNDPRTGTRGDPAEGNNLLTMVVDCRRVLHRNPAIELLVRFPVDSDEYLDGLRKLCDALGGEYPGGSPKTHRKVVPNHTALAATSHQETSFVMKGI